MLSVCVEVTLDAWMYLPFLQNAPQGWSREHKHSWFFLLFFHSPLFASRTQLPHLTFSICPLPRGQLARVSKRGHRTSWILPFNVHSPSSPWWCTQISSEDIAQLRGFLRWLLRNCSYFWAMLRLRCVLDVDIELVTFAYCFDISIARKRKKEKKKELASTTFNK